MQMDGIAADTVKGPSSLATVDASSKTSSSDFGLDERSLLPPILGREWATGQRITMEKQGL